MAVSEAQARATRKWKEKNIRRISLEVSRTWWETEVSPAIEKSGESINGYIKKAITDRIKRES